jgi:hypothetical protein
MLRLKKVVLMVLALGVFLAATSQAAAGDNKADKKKKKTAGKAVAGTVVDVKQESGKEEGTIKVSVRGKKKANEAATEKTFKITSATKLTKVTGKAKEAKAAAGETVKFSALAKDQRVFITAKGDTVEEIKIAAGKATKKKKKNAQ